MHGSVALAMAASSSMRTHTRCGALHMLCSTFPSTIVTMMDQCRVATKVRRQRGLLCVTGNQQAVF